MTERVLPEWVERVISPQTRAMSAYQVAPSAGLIKLDAMENPYGWPREMLLAWSEVLAEAALNRYPDPDPRRLKELLAESFEVPEGMELLLGNGSDELIQILQTACFAPGRSVLAPEPGFAMYQVIARGLGLRYVGVPLLADFSLAVDAMLAAMRQHQPVLTFIAFPNNPTGNLFVVEHIERLIGAAPGLVIIDEAYSPFAGETMMAALTRHPNLLVLRTLSKMGLAGIRLGFLAGAPVWIEQFNKIRLPYNVGVLTQLTAEFVLRHRGELDRQAAEICRERDWLAAQLRAIEGLIVYPSKANFLLFRVGPGQAGPVFERLRRDGVLIKLLDNPKVGLRDCLRVTVGSDRENRIFLAALRAAVLD